MDAKVTFIFIDFNLEHHIFQCKNKEKWAKFSPDFPPKRK